MEKSKYLCSLPKVIGQHPENGKDITINSGTDFEQIYEIQSTSGKMVDLTGYSAAAQIRKHRESSTAISFTVGFPDRLNGKIKLSIPSWITSRLKSGRRVYDIRFVKPNVQLVSVTHLK